MARMATNRIPPTEPPADDASELVSVAVAAELLNVGRSYLERLLDEGTIPALTRGKERVVRRMDVLAYRRERDAQREVYLKELIRLSEEAGMDDIDYAAIIRREC